MRQPLPIFTPSLATAELLERVFVARETLLEDIVTRIKAAADSPTRNHTLLVGPRGAGKTHLITLAHHRAAELKRQGLGVQLAWLPEDLWAATSYRRLLDAIVDHLEPGIEGEPRPTSAEGAENFLSARARVGGPVVLFVENLDQVLDAIGPTNQQRLRHLAQERTLLFVASTTTLSRDLSDQAAPFYGFFTTTRLVPLSVDSAADMLRNIAEVQGLDDVADYLESEQAHARLRTVAHLAGGQPRIWALLSQAVTKQGLDELVQHLLTKFDDLTPYYQEQLSRLSPQQRDIVVTLAELDHPASVKELADATEIEQRSLAKTLVELRERGWVVETDSPLTRFLDRRRTYYELGEPLARLAFQLKASRGGTPIQLIVEFLKSWFDPRDLAEEATLGELTKTYVRAAAVGHEKDAVLAVSRRLQALPASRIGTIDLLGRLDDACAALLGGDAELLLTMPSALRAAVEAQLPTDEVADEDFQLAVARLRIRLHREAMAEFGHVPHPRGTDWLSRASDLVSAMPSYLLATAVVAEWLGRIWRFDEANEVLGELARLVGEDNHLLLQVQASLAFSYDAAGLITETVALRERIASVFESRFGQGDRRTLSAQGNLAVAYARAGRESEATERFEHLAREFERVAGQEHPETITSWANLAVVYSSAGRLAEAIALEELVVQLRERSQHGDDHNNLTAWMNLAGTYQAAGRISEAIAIGERVIARLEVLMGRDHPVTLDAWGKLATSYWSASRLDEAVKIEERVVAVRGRVLGQTHPDTLRAQMNLATSYGSLGRTADAISLLEQITGDIERVIGRGHPHTLITLMNLATCYAEDDRLDQAIPLLREVATEFARSLGPDHQDTLAALDNLGAALARLGQLDEASRLHERVVSGREELFGLDHPATQTSLMNLALSYRGLGRDDDADAIEQRLAEALQAPHDPDVDPA
jgi:tetratricopeptide (TPR) repeat protein